jgi:hypothetical protein
LGSRTMADAVTALIEEAMSALRLPASSAHGWRAVYENVMGFYHAIDWKEPFIVGLLAFLLSMWALVIVTRRHVEVQMGLLVLVCGIAYFAPTASSFAAPHWRAIARQNYFDRQGIFAMLMVTLPMTLLAFVQLVSLRPSGTAGDSDTSSRLHGASSFLVQVLCECRSSLFATLPAC